MKTMIASVKKSTKIAGRPRLTTLKPSRTLRPLAAFMDFFTLAIIVFIAIYLLKTQQQRRHTLLLAQYLGRFQIEKLMGGLIEGYLRALGENEIGRASCRERV